MTKPPVAGLDPVHREASADAQANGRRHVDPTVRHQFHALMRNDFLTPQGAPYRWQEITAAVTRTVAGSGGEPTVVPVRYTWQYVRSRTGTPSAASRPREWTFARDQSFDSVLPHRAPVDISYPDLPKSPAVDLLLMLSWDVITFELLATHLATTRALCETGATAELDRISGSWVNLRFSGMDTTAVFRNAMATGTRLGYGVVGGRSTSVYGYQCLDCDLIARSGPIAQDGRSSYWGTVQVDAETGDLVVADMTEMIVAVLTSGDGRRVPVQKRRQVRIWDHSETTC